MAVAHKGSISMGMVLIPVGLYKTTVDNDIHFNQLEKESKARIKYKKYCSHCGKEVKAEDIIRSYIDLSKMELDDIEALNQKVNLVNDVIQNVLEIPEYSSNMKKMKLNTEFKIHPVIPGDPNLLQIVVTNLVNNAIKYGRENTEIKISVYQQDNNAVFSIYNEGVGISKEDIETKLFSKFGRLRQKGTEGVKGSGLGLYICKKIIEKHNGKLWAESVVGEFVNFFFTIPIAEK